MRLQVFPALMEALEDGEQDAAVVAADKLQQAIAQAARILADVLARR